jgi:hypothetical protein
MEGDVRYVIAFLLVGHAIAHLPGFLVGWQLASFPELPFRTTVLANLVDVGPIGARIVGTSWMIVSLMLVAMAAAIALQPTGWPPALPVVVALSALLCLLGWPEAKIGLAVNGLIALGLAAVRFGSYG